MKEFRTMQRNKNNTAYESVAVQGQIIGQWGIYKDQYGYNVVYIPHGSGIGIFDQKTMAMVIARKAQGILGQAIETITLDAAKALKQMTLDMKKTDVTRLYRTNGLPRVKEQ